MSSELGAAHIGRHALNSTACSCASGLVLPTDVQSHGLLSPVPSLPPIWHPFLLNGVSGWQSSSAVGGLASKNCIWAPE